ncbi:MAG TPA: protein kinase, partial [Kofleriaceae bacterium]
SPAQKLAAAAGAAGSAGSAGAAGRALAKPRKQSSDDVYLGQVLNNRFKIESKIGEGGFGAVYRGVQLATGRKVALKLLHPEMTKDENLVARFRREGMVLCNLRDAHTITTYDFDQTPDGTLYIAMELLEGKSLHQLFHEEAPLDWRRVFKILTEMCSSLAEAHTQGIVHRDLKPENIYLESRSGNPEFVKILDFGIAKVMRGDTIDPQSPQLTATGQTLGTLEYMSPEQLMGKPLDGRSDVYALGVLAYEMTTGRLPFPDAKGPAGLITAQLKQTPVPPSQANARAQLSEAADRAILKCLEKDKNNRFPNVTALAAALQEAMTGQPSERPRVIDPSGPASGPERSGVQPRANRAQSPVDRAEARRIEPQPVAQMPMPQVQTGPGPGERSSGLAPMGMGPGLAHTPMPPPVMTPPIGSPMFVQQAVSTPFPPQPAHSPMAMGAGQSGVVAAGPMGTYPQVQHAQQYPQLRSTKRSSRRFLWWLIALLAVGAAVGTALAMLFYK